MNKEEELYLPHVKAALEAKEYPTDAVQLILESPYVAHIVGDAWRNHLEPELSQGWFERRWFPGAMRCWWLWQPNMELDKLPQDVAKRAEETMRRKKRTQVEAGSGAFFSSSGVLGSGFKKPSR